MTLKKAVLVLVVGAIAECVSLALLVPGGQTRRDAIYWKHIADQAQEDYNRMLFDQTCWANKQLRADISINEKAANRQRDIAYECVNILIASKAITKEQYLAALEASKLSHE